MQARPEVIADPVVCAGSRGRDEARRFAIALVRASEFALAEDAPAKRASKPVAPEWVGFARLRSFLPGGWDDFFLLGLLELRDLGLFRTEYEGATLREHLGLARPVSRYAKAAAPAASDAVLPVV
jgi:hypothetical protein